MGKSAQTLDGYVESAVHDLEIDPKAPGLEGALDSLCMSFWGHPRRSGFCVKCGGEVKPEDFRDSVSLAKYKISALCQVCQDELFEEPEEEDDSG